MPSIHRSLSKWLCVALAVCALAAGGCTHEPKVDLTKVGQVKGNVAYKGAPVRGARLTFRSKTVEEPAFGVSDAQGNFTAMTNDTMGILPGEYVVTVNHPQMKLPAKYGEAESSPVKLTVAAGEDRELPIALED